MISKHKILIFGTLFFCVMICYAAVNAYQSFQYRMSIPGWEPSQTNDRLFVKAVHKNTQDALVLQKGDEVIALNGQKLGALGRIEELSRMPPGATYSMTIERQGQTQELQLTTTPFPPSMQLFFELLAYWIPAIFLLTGLSVFLLKPDDKQALVLSLMLGTFVLPLSPAFTGLSWPFIAVLIAGTLAFTCFWPLFFHLFLIFPERSPLFRRYPRLEFYLYLPTLLIFLPYKLLSNLLLAVAPGLYYSFAQNYSSLFFILNLISCCGYLTAGILSLLINYRQVNVKSRRKLRVVVAGCLAGFLPICAFFALVFTSIRFRISPVLLPWMAVISVSAFALFPLSFTYAIVRHQVIPIRVIIRRGIRYIFVSRGSVVVETVTMIIAVGACLKAFFTYFQTSSGEVIGLVSTVVGIGAWNLTAYLHHRMVAPAIDRRFFRRAYNAQQIFAELGTALRVMNDTQQATELVSTKIQDALQTENVIVFLQDSETGDYVCATTSQPERGKAQDKIRDDFVLRRDAFIVGRLRESAQPLGVDFADPSSWVHVLVTLNENAARRHEYETLRQINSALLLPVATKDEMHGIVSLGPRLGDLPFSREDRMLLTSLAWQLAFAIENAQLVERKIEEERLRHELEMATAVQQRLFPRKSPVMAGLELAGVCYPARGVGGDYYDFLKLKGGKIGIAVADVAGKGMSAALVMSIVQASLRSQADAADGHLTELVSSMNQLLHHSTSSNSYATFFYAQYEEQTRRLTYVNAGHNPPLLLRGKNTDRLALSARATAVTTSGEWPRTFTSGKTSTVKELPLVSDRVVPLLTGGTVIGLFENKEYEQETITLQPDDILLAYTDGVTEALNPRGEEFSEDRLQRIALRNSHLTVEEIKTSIIEAVYAWCQDEPQHDDITLVVMKVTG